MKTLLLIPFFALPMVASASTLTEAQVGAILGLLRAFNAPESVVAQVELSLAPRPLFGAITPQILATSTVEGTYKVPAPPLGYEINPITGCWRRIGFNGDSKCP